MELVIYFFAGAVVIAALLAAIAIRARQGLGLNVAALALAALLMAVGYGSFLELLGRPKPASMEWLWSDAEEAHVVASRLVEGKAIFVWLEFEGQSAPRAYSLPWELELALQLEHAVRQAEADGTEVQMRGPFVSTDGDDETPTFYAEPQPALPPKDGAAG